MQFRTYAKVLIFLAAGRSLLGMEVPRVLILPVENISGNSDYDYIKSSITSDLQVKMHERLAFIQVPDTIWQKTASESGFLFPEEFHLRSVAMQLGLLLNQDMVLTGFYDVQDRARKSKTAQLTFKFRILSVADRKVLTEFTATAEPNAKIFDRIRQIADLVTDQASAVLPNKTRFSAGALSFAHWKYLPIQLAIGGGTSTGISGKLNTSLGDGGKLILGPADFPGVPEFIMAFRYRLRKRNGVLLFASLMGAQGSASKSLSGATLQTKVEMSAWHPVFGFGYRADFSSRLYFLATLGPGWYFGRATVNLNFPGTIVQDQNTGAIMNEYSLSYSAPTANIGVGLGAKITEILSAEIGVGSRAYFSPSATSVEAQFSASLAFSM